MKKNTKSQGNSSEILRDVIIQLGVPLNRLPEILSLKSEDCLDWWSLRNPKVKISDQQFGRLSMMTGIDENLLFSGQYDKQLARQRLLGGWAVLPEKYQQNQQSYLRTSAHIMRYLELTRGRAFADRALVKMNVSPLLYQDTNQKVNLTYFADLLSTLVQMGLTRDELDTLAAVLFLSLKSSPLGKRFATAESYFDSYKTLSESYEYFDTNFDVKNLFVGKKYIVKMTLPLQEHPGLQKNPESLQRLMRYRNILMAWFPYMAGMTPLFPVIENERRRGVWEVNYEFNLGAGIRPQTNLFLVQ